MKERLQVFIKSIYAGFMIGIGGIVFLSIENKMIASFFFSFGLLTIVMQGFHLYTGKIGFVQRIKELPEMLIVIVGNYIGTFLAALGAKLAQMNINSETMVYNKLNNDLLNVLLLAIFCGIMMYLAIDNYKRSKNIVLIILPVMIFILSGFEHSIANMFYFHLAGAYDWKAFAYLLIMLAGNGIGAQLFGLIRRLEQIGQKESADK